ncbi:hypothetical protein AMS68_005869 [Peltaster fructicola]|uniref:Chloride channel protein n=1 Tax=Peltaster fructicola TaxID=286661 RepID=A0A6H0XZZ6_9PEZI|nr:hypothetical protein AMS68_005869 [Peltaster fructicola]
MSSSSTETGDPDGKAPATSSRSKSKSPARDNVYTDEDEVNQHDLLADDYLGGNSALNDQISFKRQVKLNKPSFASRFLSSPFSSSSRNATPTSEQYEPQGLGSQTRGPSTNTILSYLNTSAVGSVGLSGHDAKDAAGLDWYVEGPGRRVGYDDLTAIDWIYEYAKERTRIQHLTASSTGLLGQLKILADSSQIWWILVCTGIAVGAIAASIDIVSDWLGDLKQGVCSNVEDGGRFYLNKIFCCWGIDSLAACPDWRPWGQVLGISNFGGSYVLGYLFFVIFSVCFAFGASIMVNRYSLYAKQSGIPEVKSVLGGFVIRRFLGAWTLIVKSFGLCLAVASGMWLGKEGPLVHVACCCANIFMKVFPGINDNEARKREVLSAAAASGISVAFGSPIGGVLFSLEQLSYYFPDKTMWASFVCAMVAAVTLQAIDPFRTGKLVLYQVTYHSGWHAFELVPFAILGVMGGLHGALFIRLNMWISRLRKSSVNPFLQRPVLEVVVVALITALISFPVSFLRAQSSELVEYLFAECVDIQSDELGLCKSGVANTGVIFALLASSIVGFFLASFTFGLQIPAGILLPSMAIGALYGRVVGLIVEVWQREHPSWLPFASCEPDKPCVTPGTYAVIGAASGLAGTTRMTVSIVVIMFELTGALTYVLPIMVAVMISKWVGDAFGKRGIYEAWIRFQGYPFLDNKDDAPVPDVAVSQIMTRIEDLVCIASSGHTIESLRELLKAHRFRGFPVIQSSQMPILLGYISRTELLFALDSATSSPAGRALPETTEAFFSHQPLTDPTVTLDLRPWMDQTPITLSSKSGLQLTSDMFQKLGLRYIVLVDRGRLAGLMTKKDLWLVLNEGDTDRAGQGTGVLREVNDNREDERGLLGNETVDDIRRSEDG